MKQIPTPACDDPRLGEAIMIAVETGEVKTSLLQRRMRIRYMRARQLIAEMARRGFIIPPAGDYDFKPCKVMLTDAQYRTILDALGQINEEEEFE